MCVREWGGVLSWGKDCKHVSSPCNSSETKELGKLLALFITFLVSSSSLSIYKKDDIYSAKTSCTFAIFWKLLQEKSITLPFILGIIKTGRRRRKIWV